VELAQPDAYGEQYGKWRYGDLPILPETWKYAIPKDKKKQLEVLHSLMKRDDVDRLICATDAGREGELIFRLVYDRTVYSECAFRLVPREDEPGVCLMHDWIYLPSA